MWVQITVSEAVKILVSGGKVDDGFYHWGGSLKLRNPASWRKSRRHHQLERKLRRIGVGDGWWYYKKG